MQVVYNPKDTSTFASASLDRTVKVWSISQPTANFTLEGHEKGVNCVDYLTGGDRPYLVSGADDHTARVWDYQTKACVQVRILGCFLFAMAAFYLRWLLFICDGCCRPHGPGLGLPDESVRPGAACVCFCSCLALITTRRAAGTTRQRRASRCGVCSVHQSHAILAASWAQHSHKHMHGRLSSQRAPVQPLMGHVVTTKGWKCLYNGDRRVPVQSMVIKSLRCKHCLYNGDRRAPVQSLEGHVGTTKGWRSPCNGDRRVPVQSLEGHMSNVSARCTTATTS